MTCCLLTSHPGVPREIRAQEERERERKNDACAHGVTARFSLSLLIYVMTTIKLTTTRRSGEQEEEEDIKY